MKHSLKITLILLTMFFVTQLIGIFVITQYNPQTIQTTDAEGNLINQTTYNLPYGMDPPPEVKQTNIWSIAFSFAIIFAIAVGVMFILMKYNAELLLRLWFFAVVTLAIGIAINSVTKNFLPNSSLIVLAVALPLSFFKIFKRNIIVHNLTELLVYPGIAAIFVALLLAWTAPPFKAIAAIPVAPQIQVVAVILILISLYDMYAVWHAGFMQKMAKYQIQKLKVFTGFFVPYMGPKQKQAIAKTSPKELKNKKVKVNVAILGGGDIVFPIILAGVVLATLGLLQSIIISLGATIALTVLFKISQKGKFYPAMPFITAGCFAALAIAYLI